MPDTPLRVGNKLYGACGGAFGLDATGNKIVLAIGHDWVIVREQGGILKDVPMLFWGDPDSLRKTRIH